MERKQTFFQSLSIFTARIWLHYNGLRGDTRHSYQMDFESDLSRVNHRQGYKMLRAMIDKYRANKDFKNVIIYDNLHGVPVYDEVFIPTQDKYRVRLDCRCLFGRDEKGNFIYEGFESYDQQTGEVFTNPVDPDKVKGIIRAAYEYMKKRKSMPGVVHPKAIQDQTEQGRGQAAAVHSNLDRLREHNLFKNMSTEQLSEIADMLLKKKGVAA